MTTTRTNPNEFKGYSVDLLRGLAGLGPSIIGDDELFAAAQEYNSSAVENGVGTLGPALLTKDCNEIVTSIGAHAVPASVKPAAPAKPAPVDSEDPWSAYDLDALDALCMQHQVTIKGRVKTPGKLIAALEAAGVTP